MGRLIDADKLKDYMWKGLEDTRELFKDKGKFAEEVTKSFCQDIDEQPTAQPERLTDDDFETIRIHLNAHKERLCNQRRWEEAEEYQRIIDRFMAFASAQPEQRKGEWIPCSRETPTENGPYEVTVHPDYIVPGHPQVDLLTWADDGWYFMEYNVTISRYQIARYPDPIIAWRPLPEPYEGKVEHGKNGVAGEVLREVAE